MASAVFGAPPRAYLIESRGFKKDLVQADGKQLTPKEFMSLAKEKSPAAHEQMKYYFSKKGEAACTGILGLWAGVTGLNRYGDNKDAIDGHVILYMSLSIVFWVNSHASGLASDDFLNRAIGLYNEDTMNVSFNTDKNSGLCMRASWQF